MIMALMNDMINIISAASELTDAEKQELEAMCQDVIDFETGAEE